MMIEMFCEKLERKLLPDVNIVELPTEWDKEGTHHRVPSCLLLVRGERVFPRHRDMISLVEPNLKQVKLTVKSFNTSLGIKWYIKEWEYDSKRVELFTSIRDRAIIASKSEKSRLVDVKMPSSIPKHLLKSLLDKDNDISVSMLMGESGIEIQRLCQIERQKLGCITQETDNDPYTYYRQSRSIEDRYMAIQKLVGLYQLPQYVHR